MEVNNFFINQDPLFPSYRVRIRDVVKEDIPRLAELEQQLFPEDEPYSERMIAYELSQPYTWYFVAEQYGESSPDIVGYAGLAFLGPHDDLEVEIHTIGVDPRMQRRGVGRVLMDAATGAADECDAPMYLEVRTDNDPAIRLYASYGFLPQGIRKNYYESSGTDAYTMMRARKSETGKHGDDCSGN